jgi:hypothetical protein
MDGQLTPATWFWLLVPMLGCVGLSILTLIVRPGAERRSPSARGAGQGA